MKAKESHCWKLAVAAVVCSLVGCSKQGGQYDATVQGNVIIDGELADNGTVTFHPADKGPLAVGTIAKDGSYSLRIGQGNPADPGSSTIPAGEYVVTVAVSGPAEKGAVVAEGGPPLAGPHLMAEKYASKEASPLRADVNKGPNVIALKLEGPWANEKAEGDKGDEQPEAASEAAAAAAGGEIATTPEAKAPAKDNAAIGSDDAPADSAAKDPEANSGPAEEGEPVESPPATESATEASSQEGAK